MWPAVVAAGVGVLLFERINAPDAPRVFVSYDYDGDKHYKRLLTAWAANDRFNLSFADHSTDVSVKSQDPAVIRRAISRRIREADVFLCIVGPETADREWVNWEIDKAFDLAKPIVAVKVDRSYETPPRLYNCGARWVYRFTHDGILDALSPYI